jgi:hypothetical protein
MEAHGASTPTCWRLGARSLKALAEVVKKVAESGWVNADR